MTKRFGGDLVVLDLTSACAADFIWLAVPFKAFTSVVRQIEDWTGHTVVALTNAFGVSADELSGRYSSEAVAAAFPGARLVKGFNHLPATQLGTGDSEVRQVIFLSAMIRRQVLTSLR